MPGYWCYVCGGPRLQCPPGEQPGECANVNKLAEEYHSEKRNGTLRPMVGTWSKGGSRRVDREMTHTHKFDRDMDRYREARRAGEQPDNISVEGVERARKRQESHERARQKLEKAGIEVA